MQFAIRDLRERVHGNGDGVLRFDFVCGDFVHHVEDIGREIDLTALLANFGGNILENKNLVAPLVDMANFLDLNGALTEIATGHV